MDDRLEKLESHLAFLERQYDDLSRLLGSAEIQSDPGCKASARATARPPARGPRSEGKGTRFETTTRRSTSPPRAGVNDVFDYNEIYATNYNPDPGCGCSGGVAGARRWVRGDVGGAGTAKLRVVSLKTSGVSPVTPFHSTPCTHS